MWAIVPVKDFEDAKGRLSEVLKPDQRRDLARFMLQDVLSILLQVNDLSGVAIITRDIEAKKVGLELGARILSEEINSGQTNAVLAATLMLKSEGVAGILAMPGDIPLVSKEDIAVLLTSHNAAPAMTIVPAHDFQGSNCVLCSPPDCVRLRFGDNSYYPHLEAAREAGIEPLSITLPNVGLDIDKPCDLAALAAHPVRSRAQEYLFGSGIAEQLIDLAADQECRVVEPVEDCKV